MKTHGWLWALGLAAGLAACGTTTTDSAAADASPGDADAVDVVAADIARTPSGAPILLGIPADQPGNPPGTRPEPTLPEGTDLLPPVAHIVVLMMENHSFDNYFGMLGRGDGFTLGPDGLPTNANPDASGQPVRAYHLPTTSQVGNHVTQNWVSSHKQWHGGLMDGFVVTSGVPGMGYWTGVDLPFYYALAKTFPLCDRYFGSVMAQTYPNRRFLQAASAFGLLTTTLPPLDQAPPPGGTIFDKLDKFGIPWLEYSAGFPSIAIYPYVYLSHTDHTVPMDQFLSDAAAGTLPAFSMITPHPNVSEENPQDIHQGEAFAAGVLRALMQGPAWSKTVVILTYDEHGGYYDHVPPPPAFVPDNVPPDPAKVGDFPGAYDRYGFRVPTVVIAPFARADYVSHVVHDHTSILRLLETKWNLGALTWRDANASNLLDCLDFVNPPAFATPPKLTDPAWPANAIQVPPDDPTKT